MHVAVDLNLNWLLQLIATAFIVAIGLHRLVKNTASKYFVVDAAFDSSSSSSSSSSDSSSNSDRFDINNHHIMSNNHNNINNFNNNINMIDKEKNLTAPAVELCPVCRSFASKRCSGCRTISYCSQACQRSHWNSEHKTKCKNPANTWRGKKAISLVPSKRTSNVLNQSKKILFPYEEFVELFKWDNLGFPPCGLLNCGNSCFANVVLQCLTYTKPLVAYLLKKGHRRECRRNDWCFLCEFQTHLEKASRSQHPFSPINILSRLQNIGGNLGYGSQEDAHELMRFAIDTMQSVCLDEFGGEKAVHPSSQETTMIQHIFGGHLQSQVICTKCNSISNQLENMMDLTVEIQGDAGSLEECLDQFTAKEWLHGENMYKCDRCNDYVTAWKRLTIQMPPNILTIALKRFQSGRFGKLNKRVTFPATLDLSPYMSKAGDDGDFYKLYAVIVHVDMLNASFFGHYICYIKDFCGNWYRVDDCKVARVDLYDVLSQGAYMLLYRRAQPRPTSLYPSESRNEVIQENKGEKKEVQCTSPMECEDSAVDSSAMLSTNSSVTKTTPPEEEFFCVRSSEDVKTNTETSSSVLKDVLISEDQSRVTDQTAAASLAPFHEVLTGDASLTCTNSNEADAMQVESTSPVSDVEDKTGRTKTDSGNCNGYSSEKDTCRMPLDISPSLSLPSSGGTVDAGRKSEGTGCSGPKFKPLFPAGFLGKRPRNKPVRKDLVFVEKNCGRASASSSCGPSSGSANTDLRYQNGVITDEKKQPNFERTDISSTNTLSKQAEMLHHTTQMGVSKSGELIDVHIGDSSEKIDISVTEKRDLVAEENIALDGRSNKDVSLCSS